MNTAAPPKPAPRSTSRGTSDDLEGRARKGKEAASKHMIGQASIYSRIKQMLTDTVTGWIDDGASSMGAALAFYTMFSLAPVLLIAITLAGLVFSQEIASAAVLEQLRAFVGEQGAQVVQAMLESARLSDSGPTATLIGVVLLLVGATTVLAELQNALDRIWQVPQDQPDKAPTGFSSGVWNILRTRLLSFGIVLSVGFLLLVSLVLTALLSIVTAWLGAGTPGWTLMVQWLNMGVGFALTAGMFALIYKLMPRARVAWRDVWIGAVATALLFTVGKSLIGLYIGTSGVGSAYGAAGSLAVLLIWVYYSAQVFLLGAEFTWAYARHFGSLQRPAAQFNLPEPA